MTVKQHKQIVFNRSFLQISGIKRDNKTTTNPVDTQEGLFDIYQILISKIYFT